MNDLDDALGTECPSQALQKYLTVESGGAGLGGLVAFLGALLGGLEPALDGSDGGDVFSLLALVRAMLQALIRASILLPSGANALEALALRHGVRAHSHLVRLVKHLNVFTSPAG